MNRAIAVTATLAMGTMVAAVTIVPAMAAARPGATHPVSHATTTTAKTKAKAAGVRRQLAAQQVGLPGSLPVTNGSELDNAKYVTVVHCQGTDTPPPITLAKPGTPLRVNGTGQSAGILQMLQQPNPYKTVYTCTVVVKVKVAPKPKPNKFTGCEIKGGGGTGGGSGKRCTKPVTLNTGFGGLAARVRDHRPAGS